MHSTRGYILNCCATLGTPVSCASDDTTSTGLVRLGNSGDVYVMTNQSSGNSFIVFHWGADGSLTLAGSLATGRTGMGIGADALASQRRDNQNRGIDCCVG